MSQTEPAVAGRQVSAFRLARHHLADRRPVDLVTACRDACGIQAQVMSAAYLALWARKHDATWGGIDAALRRDRTLVKTSAMRGTLHLLAAADLPVYTRALQGSRLRAMRKIMSRYGVSAREADLVRDAVVDALAAGPRTRSDLQGRVLSLGIVRRKSRPWFEQSWWGVVRQSIVEGLVCYAPDQGPETTLVRVDQWLPRRQEVGEEEAQKALLRRYLRAFGPATLRDFSYWAGIPVGEARPIWDSLADERATVSVEGRTASVLRRDARELATADLGEDQGALRLLPTFDVYLLGHAEKHHLVSAPDYPRVFRGAGWISAVVLREGVVIGVWSQSKRGGRASLEVQPFGRLSAVIRARIEEEAASLSRFLGVSLDVCYKR